MISSLHATFVCLEWCSILFAHFKNNPIAFGLKYDFANINDCNDKSRVVFKLFRSMQISYPQKIPSAKSADFNDKKNDTVIKAYCF